MCFSAFVVTVGAVGACVGERRVECQIFLFPRGPLSRLRLLVFFLLVRFSFFSFKHKRVTIAVFGDGGRRARTWQTVAVRRFG